MSLRNIRLENSVNLSIPSLMPSLRSRAFASENIVISSRFVYVILSGERNANLDMFQQLLFWKEVGDDLIIKCERSSATNIKALGDRPVSNEYYIYTKRTGVLFDCPFLSFC